MSAASSLDHSRLIERLAGRLRWREAVDGVSAGQGRGSRSAASGEFDNHVRWCPGDDLQRLDLRVWLRLRQHWTRSYRDDSSEPLTIILDGGASMGFGDKPQAVSWTCELFLAVARSRRDPHRLWILDDGNARVALAGDRSGVATRGDLRSALQRVKPTGSGPGRVVVISDRIVFDDLDDQLQGLNRWAKPIWISPWLPEEVAPTPSGQVRLEAKQEPPWIGTIDRSSCQRYRQRFDRYQRALRSWLTRRGGSHLPIDASQHGDALIRPLLHRSGPLEVVSG
ncbi:MAG TPA: DUF58 domain-containing protein [Planctomycetes bacterium]|nr:DUF58 domain-containing protein [Planctomycetota bacterium]HIK83130.1 DUF58 domain-containing protein [Planctomycetota bacterium]